jgi:hypothetical protein
MHDVDRTEFYAVWVALADLYGKTIQPKSAEIVFAVLRRYDIGTIKRAIAAHLADTESGQFMPKPADIIRQIEGGSDVRALNAWTKVDDAIRNVGSWASLVFDDPAIHCCVEDMGGWMQFASVTNDELPFLRNQFTKRYQGYITNPPTRWAKRLMGEGGTESVRFIGLEENCREVMLGGDGGIKQISAPQGMAAILDDAKKLLGVQS